MQTRAEVKVLREICTRIPPPLDDSFPFSRSLINEQSRSKNVDTMLNEVTNDEIFIYISSMALG